MLPYERNLKPLSRNLRSGMTDAEQLLWARLRRKQVLGGQFYRQKPLAGYIADFYCAAANLVIELDGSQHLEPAGQAHDLQRTEQLESLGLRMIRFDNRQVLLQLDDVMNVIFAEVARAIPPSPPFSKGGAKLHRTNQQESAGGGSSTPLPQAHTASTATAPVLEAHPEANPPLCKRGARGDSLLPSTPSAGETP